MRKILMILPMSVDIGARNISPLAKMFLDQIEVIKRENWDITLCCSFNTKLDGFKLVQPSNEFDSYLDQERDVVNVVKNHLNRFDIIHSHTLTHQIYALPDVDKLPLCATFHNLPHNLPSMIDTPCFIGGTEYISDYIKMYVGTYAETINDTMNKRWFKQTDKKLDHFLYDGLVESNSVLDAIKLSKHHLLYIIGSCSSYSLQLENVISYYRILGEVSYQIERLLYQSAEYLINPSDPTGLKSIQAMLSGTPIISKRTEFNKEFVNVKNGYLYSDEDDALACMSKENKWDFRLNDKFNFDVQMERYLDAYERIIGEDKW